MHATAALLEQAGQPFVLSDIELDYPRPTEVRVRMSAVGICATDLEFSQFFATPAVLGHEGSGIVDSVGSKVTSVKPGDHVALSFTSCGTCSLCRAGTPSYCRQFDALNFSGRRTDGTTAISRPTGEEVNGHFLGQSSFATHAIVPERAVTVIAPHIDLNIVGPFGCGFQTGAGSVLNILQPRPGQSIAVFGAGSVGVAAIIAAAMSGCSIVAAVDVNAAKLDAATGFGATHVVNSAEGETAGLLSEIAPDGFDFVIDTTGRADVLRTGVEALGPLGRAGVIGAGPSETMTFDWRSVLNGRSITGIIGGASLPQSFIPELLRLNEKGLFPVDKLITYFPFEQINEAIAAMRSGEVGKAVLTF